MKEILLDESNEASTQQKLKLIFRRRIDQICIIQERIINRLSKEIDFVLL